MINYGYVREGTYMKFSIPKYYNYKVKNSRSIPSLLDTVSSPMPRAVPMWSRDSWNHPTARLNWDPSGI